MVAPVKAQGRFFEHRCLFDPHEWENIMPTSIPVKATLLVQNPLSPLHVDVDYGSAFVLIIWTAVIAFLIGGVATGRLPSIANGQTFPSVTADNLDWTSM
jgi:uncharacterized protein YqjF (DUF2071 family)